MGGGESSFAGLEISGLGVSATGASVIGASVLESSVLRISALGGSVLGGSGCVISDLANSCTLASRIGESGEAGLSGSVGRSTSVICSCCGFGDEKVSGEAAGDKVAADCALVWEKALIYILSASSCVYI